MKVSVCVELHIRPVLCVSARERRTCSALMSLIVTKADPLLTNETSLVVVLVAEPETTSDIPPLNVVETLLTFWH